MNISPCGCKQCPSCEKWNQGHTMRCSCGFFYFQLYESTSPTVPDSTRIVVLEERNGAQHHIGWFNAPSGHWMVLSEEQANGDKMPKGEFCSKTIGNITNWKEIDIY